MSAGASFFITAFPLIPALSGSVVYAGVVGQIPAGQVMLRAAILILIEALMLYSYVRAGRAAARAA